MNLGRRGFLQRLSLTLAALGVGETLVSNLIKPYYAALAEPGARKLALLIGINQYPDQAVDPTLEQGAALLGCLADVEMQRELLLHRFGFKPADILVLTNQQASRSGIKTAFESHLQQARKGDVVLVHFSGYGSQVRSADNSARLFRSLVPVDGLLPTEAKPEIADIFEIELLRWLQNLKTKQITTILDAGHRDLGQLKWGTLRLRSRPAIPTGTVPPELISKLPLEKVDVSWPGLLIRSSSTDRLVLEKDWSGFSSGVFTYALTQTLWESLPSTSFRVIIHRASETLRSWTGPDQKPELSYKQQDRRDLAPYHLTVDNDTADGVITKSASDTSQVTFWLGGVPAAVLEHLQPNSRFIVAASGGNSEDAAAGTVLKIKSRKGLEAQAAIEADTPIPEVGKYLYEQVRIYSRKVVLIVALDPNLERIERVDATSALSSIPFVSFTVSGNQPADCLFGRLPQVPLTTLTAALPAHTLPSLLVDSSSDNPGVEHSYGLFSPNRTLIPETLTPRDEAVKTAVNRLTPQFQSLLAMKLLRLTENFQSSPLSVRATLETTRPRERLLLQRQTLRPQSALPKSQLPSLVQAESQDFAVSPASRLRYRLSNFSDQPLYFTLVSFDSGGQFWGLVPNLPLDWSPNQDVSSMALENALVLPGKTQNLPQNTMDWGVTPSAIWVETFVIVSVSPLQKTWKALRGDNQESPRQPGLSQLSQPLKIARALLDDLHDGTIAANPNLSDSEHYVLATSTWATFSFRYAIASAAI